MVELSHKAYEKIQRVIELIHEKLESQIEPSPVLFESNKLPNDVSEKTFTDALKYLSEEGLISYDSDTKNTPAFYEYDKKYKDALEVINSADYFINEDKIIINETMFLPTKKRYGMRYIKTSASTTIKEKRKLDCATLRLSLFNPR